MPRRKAGTVTAPVEVTLQYMIPLYVVVRDYGNGMRITKVVVDDDADLEDSEAFDPSGRPLSEDDPLVISARDLVELGPAAWPAWEFGW